MSVAGRQAREQVGDAEEARHEVRPGLLVELAGRPELLDRPRFMTAIVSAMVMASSWSCVTWTKVTPSSLWIILSSSCICRRSLRSSAPSGSSSSSTRGRFTSARASATRCCWPPESWRGLRDSRPARSTSLRISRTRPPMWFLQDSRASQPERDVLEDGEVREERVALEDRVHVALVGRKPEHALAAEEDRVPRSAPRSRRSCAASSSSRSRRARGGRRSCRPGSRSTRRRPRPRRQSAW